VTQTFPPDPSAHDAHDTAPPTSDAATTNQDLADPNGADQKGADTSHVVTSNLETAALDATDGIAAADRVVEDEPLQPNWQALPPRAHTVFRYVSLLTSLMTAAIVSLALYSRYNAHQAIWIAIAGVFAVAIVFGLWLAYRRYRYTFWKLDRDGFAVKRGRLWQWETRVPTTRVQHMDIKRGPLERMNGLASVVLHTAGTRLGAVSVSGMDHHDAERLRDYLTRQIDRQDGDDPEHA
jgi:uncharacterized protein